MITEKDLQEAIAECLGQRNPSSSTCIKLAAFYTIQNQLYGSEFGELPERKESKGSYSYESEKEPDRLSYYGGSFFGQLINGKTLDEVCDLVDELMEALEILNPKLYDGFVIKLQTK